ncbi:CIC11C00000000631 [Sungouiella intermedia]|uniref:CIC11C00000000631 n=1 Tax=Sungouiella intermedia TaxID=45354 RepID=A0A1L0DSU4_9ASCO|nr:CIC11C00000000631 [[Candida] intermedia]
MSLTSLELNYLIWRYLQESGYELAAFALEKKSQCLEYEHDKNKFIESIEPGCLVNLVQKGILYTFVEDAAEGKEERLTLVNALIKENELKQAETDTSQNFQLKSQANGGLAPDVEMEDATTGEDAEKSNNDVAAAPESQVPEESHELPFTTSILKPFLHFSPSVAAQWHPHSEVLAFGREDALALIHALDSHGVAESVTLNHPPVLVDEHPVNNEISTITWAPQGAMILTSGIDGEIRAWTPDGRLKNIVNSATDSERVPATLYSLIWNSRGLLLLTIDVNNTVAVWDGATLAPVGEILQVNSANAHPIPSNGAGHPNLIRTACWVSDSKFAILTSNNAIKIYSVNPLLPLETSVTVVGQLVGHQNTISTILFGNISKLLASASDVDYTIKVWNSSLSQDALELNVSSENEPNVYYHTTPIVCLTWLSRSGDIQGNELLSVSMDGAVNIWDAFSGDSIVSANIFRNPDNFRLEEDIDIDQKNALVFVASVSPDFKYLAVGDDSGNVSIWDIQLLHYRDVKDLLRCEGIYAVGKKDDIGICDIVWDAKGTHLCVCYKGVDSIILEWSESKEEAKEEPKE